MDQQYYLIIGGTSGIGAAITDKMIGAGHHVITVSRTPGTEELKSNNLTHLTADILNEELALHDHTGSLAGLVYCPGTINLKPFRALKDDDFIHDYMVNVIGATRCLKAALPMLKSHGSASVVLFSTVAVGTGMTFHSSVAAAKGAVEGLGRSLAAEFAPQIRVNVIAPSLTDTPLASRLLDTAPKTEAAAARHPMKRTGTPEDIANLAAFLLSCESSWITGQVIHVDGGLGSIRN